MHGLGRPRSVERVETQVVNREDGMFAGSRDLVNWDADWPEHGGDAQKEEAEPTPPQAAEEAANEDEGVSAWGWDDEAAEEEAKPANGAATSEDDGAEAWGWGDDENESLTSPETAKRQSKQNGEPAKETPVEREITLRESYHISAIPEQILESIVKEVEDADALSKAE
jgi:protein transport protein DSL1/ZW10